MKDNKDREEYYVITEKLEEVDWALEGKCNDIDCDMYIYKDLLKKKYKSVLEHNFSCLPSLKREKVALLRLLSLRKFKKFRYKKCDVCKKKIDSLGKSYTLVSFTRPHIFKGKKTYEWECVQVHRGCKKKVKIPKGWNKL